SGRGRMRDWAAVTTPATTTRPSGTSASCRERRRGTSARCSKHASRSSSWPGSVGPAFEWPSGPSALAGRDGTTYAAGLGARFLTRDPLEAMTRDPYGYAGANPINRTDPTGLCERHDGIWGAVRDVACEIGEGDPGDAVERTVEFAGDGA